LFHVQGDFESGKVEVTLVCSMFKVTLTVEKCWLFCVRGDFESGKVEVTIGCSMFKVTLTVEKSG
jgi:hypothetical protein